MFIVAGRHAGREHRARRPDDGAPRTSSFGQLRRPRRDPLRGRARARPTRCSAREGAGFLIAQQRLGPGRIHHCMRWLGVSRRAFDMLCERALYRDAFGGRCWPRSRRSRTGSPTRRREMQAARLMTLHAAWMMDTAGRRGRAQGDLADQVLRRRGAARRRRPRAADPRLARLLDRPAARGDVPLRARRAPLRRARRGAPPVASRAQILRGYEPPPDGVPTEHVPDAPRARRASASPTCSRR